MLVFFLITSYFFQSKAVILMANYAADVLNTVIFVIGGSYFNTSQRFVVCFFSNLMPYCFLLFSAAILDKRYYLGMLVCNPIQSSKLKKKITKIEEKLTKAEDVRSQWMIFW